MSNHLAIATVTAVLQRTLQASVQRDVEGARISTVPPHRVGQGTPETGINLFLYHVTRNNALKNPDAMALRARNKQSPWRQAALELHYLLSFYGNDTELEPQRLMGSTVRTFNDRTTLSKTLIQDTLTDSSFSFLALSDLATQVQELQISPEDLDLEALSKIWSVFFQTPYSLSLGYKVMAVVIDGEDPAERALRVRDRPTYNVSPLPHRPLIERVVAEAGTTQPILPSSTLLIQGQYLHHAQPFVRIGGQDVAASRVEAQQILFPLSGVPPTALYAGIQTLQVVHRLQHPNPAAADATPQPTTLSNAMPFILCPQIEAVQLERCDWADDDHCTATLHLTVSPAVGVRQVVLLSLYEWSIEQPNTVVLEVPPRSTDTNSLTIPIRSIKPGTYLVRLVVDGAESVLEVDLDPTSPTHNWYDRPRIALQPTP